MSRSLTTTFLAGLMAFTSNLGLAADWTVDAAHSSIGWSVDHMMVSETEGNFKKFEGTVTGFDGDDASKAQVNVTIDVASIDSDNEDRDKHLRSEDFFAVEKFPTATFKSTKIEKKGKGKYMVTGDFTLRGVTKQVTIPMTFKGTSKDPWGNTRAGFSGDLTINRKDYGLIWNKDLDAGGVAVGDEVRLRLRVETIQKVAP